MSNVFAFCAGWKKEGIQGEICQRVEVAWQHRTQREVRSKPAGTHAMEKVVFVLEHNGAVSWVKVSMTVERLQHGPRHPLGTQRLWAAGSPEMVDRVAAVVREAQQPPQA